MFIAVLGVLLVGGTAMAANLGLLAGTTPGDRGHRLSVPRPALSVSLPTTDPALPRHASTSVSDIADGGAADNGAGAASTTTVPADGGSPADNGDGHPGHADGESEEGNGAPVDETDHDHRHDNPEHRGGESEWDDGETDKDWRSGPDDGGGNGRFDDD